MCGVCVRVCACVVCVCMCVCMCVVSDAVFDLSQRKLGDFGCKVGCCVLSDSAQDHKLVVVNNCVTQFYLPHEPAQCLVFEGMSL